MLIVDTLVFDKAQITSRQNGNRPMWGGCCHTISEGNAEQAVVIMTYQNVTGCLSQGAHPGSYNGQDAYNDMLVIDDESNKRWKRATATDNHDRNIECSGLYARCPSDPHRGG